MWDTHCLQYNHALPPRNQKLIQHYTDHIILLPPIDPPTVCRDPVRQQEEIKTAMIRGHRRLSF
jgi:hypothetical protein